MRCPNCGTEAGRAPFCPQCGADLSALRRHRTAFFAVLDRRLRHFASAMVVLMAVLSVMTVVLSALPSEEPSPVPETGIPQGAIALGDGYVVLSDGYSERFSAAVNERGHLVTSLDIDGMEGLSKIVWSKIEDRTGESAYITKEASFDLPVEDIGWLAWEASDPGTYTVSACCYSSDGTLLAAYSGSFTYVCDYKRTFEWSHGGRVLSFTYEVSSQDALDSQGPAIGRTVDSLDSAGRFVVPDGAAASLEEAVWNTYRSIVGGARQSADYAACVIGFVAASFEEADDGMTYGTAVYWAYPAETIYAGQGDSGDLAVLAASMLSAAGCDSCLARLPGMWAVGSVVVPGATAAEGWTLMMVDLGGTRFGITSIHPFSSAGSVPGVYGLSNGSVTFYGEIAGDAYGFLRTSSASKDSQL